LSEFIPMNIWLINPFSDLPNEGASKGRFCCLARVLVEQGHNVTWWTMDFHHRKKSRRSLDGRWEIEDGQRRILFINRKLTNWKLANWR